MERFPPCVAAPKSHECLSGVLRHVAGALDEIAEHCADPSPFDGALLRLPVLEGLLPHHAQDVVGDQGKLQHKLVRLELAGRKALHVHVGLELAMVLLAFPMGIESGRAHV